MFAFLGLSIYIFIKKHPGESKSLFSHANNIIKYMPIDSGTSEVLAPFLDFTNANSKINSMYAPEPEPVQSRMAPQMKECYGQVLMQQNALLVKQKRNMLLHNKVGNVPHVNKY